jgi:GntR family transcriptional regulator
VTTQLDALEQLAPMVVDRRSLPSRVTDQLRRLIIDGSLPGGAQFPTEAQLAKRFRVGRTTVREALRQLENEGAVTVRRGRGRFVSTTPVLRRPITRLESVTEMLASHGYDVENRVLEVGAREATADERSQLRLAEGDEVLRLRRLRLHAGEPLIYSVDVLPVGAVGVGGSGIDWTGSLIAALSGRGLRPETAVTTIRAAQLPPEVAEICGTDPDMPWLLMVQLNLAHDGSPVIYSHDFHRGDRFSFDLIRRAEQGAS